MKKILVTGGSGFLGSNVIVELLKKKFFVINFDLNSLNIKNKNYQFIEGNILDEKLIIKEMKNIDYVFHFAGLSDLDDSIDNAKEATNQNILGLINFLNLSKEYKIKRFFLASTLYVYSQKGSFYRITKQAAENYVKEYYKQYNLKYTILRYGSLYGKNSNKNNGIRRLLEQAVKSNEIVYQGKKNDTREYINVIDASILTVKTIDKIYENKSLIISGIDKFKAEELFRIFNDILNKKLKITYRDRKKDNTHYNMTPFSYSEDKAKKIVPESYIEFGEGILDLIKEIKQ